MANVAVQAAPTAALVPVIAFENLCGGLVSCGFVAYMMSVCDRRATATQYALLSALSAVGRVYVGPAAGYMATSLDWPTFFFVTFLIALPGIAMLWWQRARIEALDASPGG